MIDFNLLKNILIENNSFLLATHVNPDADAIGSVIALHNILQALNKKVFIVNHSATPYNLEFLDKEKVIQQFNSVKHANLFNEVDVLVGLDFNRSERLVSMRNHFLQSNKLKILIDHHQDTEDFVNHVFVDSEYSATGHILYNFISETGIVKLNYNLAFAIYAAIMTDTGSFRFDRTTPEIHRIAAKLLEQNVSPSEIFDKIYDQSKFSKIKLLGRALESMTLYGEDKKISYMVLNQEAFISFGAIESDTDSFVNFTLSVENVELGILFIELKKGFKVSFRSKGNIPVNKLAAEFGGGGHTNAAGARIYDGIFEEFIPIILGRAENYLTKN